MTPQIFKSEKFSNLTPDQEARARELFPDEYKAIEEEGNDTIKYLNSFITCYPKMLELKEEVKKLALTNDPVLIIGPTGTGKELIARALHGKRRLNDGKFVDINCAGLPENLIESELFGHVKGAFTGALIEKTGLLQSACNGTFFFDEIGELPISVQAKLLRVLQEKQARKVGADLEIQKAFPVNCRFVSATHKDLREMIKENKFREDLFHRMGTIILRIEGLENRTLDIPLLIKHIITYDRDKINFDIEDIEEFSENIVKRYRNNLSGNVRQLQNIVRHWHVLGKLPEI